MLKRVLCEFCGKPIPKERLEVLPETTCCVACSKTIPYSRKDIEGIAYGSEYEIEPYNPEDFEIEDEG